MNPQNVLYVMPPFRAVRSNIRPSFLKIGCVLRKDRKDKPISFYLARDPFGLAWVHVAEYPKDLEGELILGSYVDGCDQTLRTWTHLQVPVNLSKNRNNMILHLFQAVLRELRNNKDTSCNYCIPRMIVFKNDSDIALAYEIIDGSDPEKVAEAIGDKEQIYTEENIKRDLFINPVLLTIKQENVEEEG